MSRTWTVRVAALWGVLALGLMGGCAGSPTGAGSSSPAPAAKIQVVASTNVWGDIVQQIGGEAVEVTSIISDPDVDPHEYQASSRNQLALSKAQLVIENGGGYDDFVDTMLSASKNTSAVVLNAVELSGIKATGGAELNEHVWYDYATVQKVSEAVESALSTLDPAQRGDFAANTTTFVKGLDDLRASAAQVRQSGAGRGVAITEPVPLYLLQAMGLVNKTPEAFSEAIENETDVPSKVLSETLALFSMHRVDLLAYNAQTTGPQTERVLAAAKTAGVPVVPVQETLPAGTTYLQWQAGIIAAIREALAT